MSAGAYLAALDELLEQIDEFAEDPESADYRPWTRSTEYAPDGPWQTEQLSPCDAEVLSMA